MSRIKRWFAGAASAALLLSFAAPATGQADDAVEAPTNHAGPCVGDTGVTMVIDFQKLGGNPEVRCFTGDPEDGIEALRGAGFTMDGVNQWGDAFTCRINGRPAVDEIVPILEDPEYTEKCVRTPPANGYWSYWHSDDQGESWEYSNLGAMGYEPEQGEWEGWSFSLNATASTNPFPRTNLALAPYGNAESTQAAADWLASQWNPAADQFSAGLADGIMGLAAAEAHPEIVSEMVEALKTADTDYFSDGADSLAKMLIALDMAGQDTHHFLGCDRDLVDELDTYISDDAKSLNNWWGPQLVTIALNRLGKPVPQNVWDLLAKRQVANGSFGSPDDTGMALSALVGTHENELNPPAMRDAAKVAIDKTVAWANNPANQKTKDGNYYWATFSAANSTGMLSAGLAEAGIDISSPQAFMRAQQKLTGVGAWQSVLDRTTANYMATNQGILAVAGKGYGKALLEVPRTTTECSAPLFTTQPASVSVVAGENATFTVEVTGSPEPTVAWQKDVDGTWTTIEGATGTTLTLEDTTATENGLTVRAVGTNATASTMSNTATLTVTPVVDEAVKPVFTTQPTSTTVNAGENATFTVEVTGDPAPGITWEKDVNGIWTAIQGATGTTLTLDNVGDDSNGLKVRAVAANAAGFVVSNIATLTVKPVADQTVKPVFTTQPTSTTVNAGENATFTVEVTGDPTPGITWEKDDNGIWTAIQGATGTTLTLDKVGDDSNGLKVRAVAANAAGLAVSDIATLTVTPVVTPTPTPSASPTATVTVTVTPSTSVAPTYPKTVYNTPGYHKENGRNWFTSCEPYSITQRCRTLIEATTVKAVGGKFVASNGWTFNNLTYLPAPKSVWEGNPLAKTGEWTTAEGRMWKTECNTPQTGGNGCRSFIQARVVVNLAKPGQPVKYGWTTRWEFNNIVQFS